MKRLEKLSLSIMPDAEFLIRMETIVKKKKKKKLIKNLKSGKDASGLT